VLIKSLESLSQTLYNNLEHLLLTRQCVDVS